MDGAISTSKINRKVYGENGCANVAKVEAMDVIWKKAGDNPILSVLITLSSAMISCAYSLLNLPNIQLTGFSCQVRK